MERSKADNRDKTSSVYNWSEYFPFNTSVCAEKIEATNKTLTRLLAELFLCVNV